MDFDSVEEKDVDYWVVRELAKIGLDGLYTAPAGTPLAKSLERASKRKTMKNGKPDVLVYTDNLILVIEDKHGAEKQVVKGASPFDGALYVPELDEEPKDTAEGGAQWYLSCMMQDWPYNKPRPHVFALGISGFMEGGEESYAIRPFAWFKASDRMARLPKLNDLSVFSSDNLGGYVRRCKSSLAGSDLHIELNKIERFLRSKGVGNRFLGVMIPQFLMMGNPGFTGRENLDGLNLALEHVTGSNVHGLKGLRNKNNRDVALDYISSNWGLLSDPNRRSLSAMITNMAALSPPSYQWVVCKFDTSELRTFEMAFWVAESLFKKKTPTVCEDHTVLCRMLAASFNTVDFDMSARAHREDVLGVAVCSMILQGKVPSVHPPNATPGADIVMVDASSVDNPFDCILSSITALGSGGRIIAVVSKDIAESDAFTDERSRVHRKLTILGSLKADNQRYILVFKRGKMTACSAYYADASRLSKVDSMIDRAFGLLSTPSNNRSFARRCSQWANPYKMKGFIGCYDTDE